MKTKPVFKLNIMESFTGKKFGRLLVIEYSHTDKHRSRYFKCVCDCGNESTVK